MPHQDIVPERYPSNSALRDRIFADGFYNVKSNIIFDDEKKDRVDKETEMSLSEYKEQAEETIENINMGGIKKDITQERQEL